tara:strand:- start:456 stop:779 length:324 start_codon:yes stop_codon:yes gene_type:complete
MTEDDAVNPKHYKSEIVETIFALKSTSSPEEFQGHLRLSALKYLMRYGKKIVDGNLYASKLNDLRKAMWYLKFLENEIKKEDMYGRRGEEVKVEDKSSSIYENTNET